MILDVLFWSCCWAPSSVFDLLVLWFELVNTLFWYDKLFLGCRCFFRCFVGRVGGAVFSAIILRGHVCVNIPPP